MEVLGVKIGETETEKKVLFDVQGRLARQTPRRPDRSRHADP